MSAPSLEDTVRTYVGRQRKYIALARGFLLLPQVVNSSAPLGPARAMVQAMEENLTQLIKGLK